MSSFENSDGIKIYLKCPPRIFGGGHAEDVFVLQDGKTITVSDSSLSQTSEKDWIFQTQNIPQVLGKGSLKAFKAEDNLLVFVDDRAIRLYDLLKQNKELDFNNLAWEGDTTAFTSKRPGKIVSHDGAIFINYP